MNHKPKLIEVALPLAAINAAAAAEKKIRQGHPSALHHWWARRPLVAARAVIWASLVDDPSGYPSMSYEQQEAERQRLFSILEQLVKWENSNNSELLAEARAEIHRCWPDGPPPVLDPFCGGGAIPLEAKRLGLTALAGDLNPVAVLITKAMIEIPPRFRELPPVHPSIDKSLATWERAQGLAADLTAYGKQLRDLAHSRIGHLYPDVAGPQDQSLTPIAWIWARTVQSPDPSWRGHVPLVASWMLSNQSGKPKVWIEPIIDRDAMTISYQIREGGEPSHTRTVQQGNGTCIATGAAIPGSYIKEEGRTGRMSKQLMAIVAEGNPGRVFLQPTLSDAHVANCSEPEWRPSGFLADNSQYMTVPLYGLNEWHSLFTRRQLVALATFSEILEDIAKSVERDAVAADMASDSIRLRDGGKGARAYSDALLTYLAFAIDKQADLGCSLVSWEPKARCPRHLFGRQSIPMVWDYAESNPFSSSSGSFETCLNGMIKGLVNVGSVSGPEGSAIQMDATARVSSEHKALVSTDPPYYDNVPYADISDFFYVWLRKNLQDIWPEELSTIATPKAEELVANVVRAGSKQDAKEFFESGMARFMSKVVKSNYVDAPITIYYAYKATESQNGEIRSTGWDTFLQAVVDAGLQVNATWPLRTEAANRLRGQGSNALASSIVLACRPRPTSATPITRGEFVTALRRELPDAVKLMQSGNVAPVDLAQSTIGPGIRVFSRHQRVVQADGTPMPVSDALAIINEVLGEVLDGAEADLDSDTRFALAWFSTNGYNHGPAGEADGVARAKNTSLTGIVDAGIGEAGSGKFRLYERSELDSDWSPSQDDRLTVWEATQYLVAALEGSESEAAALLQSLRGHGDSARSLAYLLYQKANDRGWSAEASAYNSLINAWPSLRTSTIDNSSQQTLL